MTLLNEIVNANKQFISNKHNDYPALTAIPSRKLAIVTCVDTRLIGLLEEALGINRGEVKIIKTAGNTVDKGLNDTIKSLMICIYELGVREIMIIGHRHCGVAHATAEHLFTEMAKLGIESQIIESIQAEFGNWLDNYKDPVSNVITSVENIRQSEYIPHNIPVHGLLIDPDTGELEVLIDGNK